MNHFKENAKKHLSPQAYDICWNGGTEHPFTGAYNAHYEEGQYHCICCKAPLFDSHTKFDSGTGWPSFWESHLQSVRCVEDNSLFMKRIEVQCATCGAHLGHVFDDGPAPSGARYCINSASLHFKEISTSNKI